MRLLPAVFLLSLIALPAAAEQADLSAALSIQNDRTPFAGAAVNLQLTITNNGPDHSGFVAARWTIPYAPISYEITRCTLQGGNSLFCTASDLAPGASTTFLVGAFIPNDTRTTSASVSASANDPNPSNNDASLEVVPVTTPFLQPALSVSPPPAEGRQSIYALSVENHGGGTASGVHVRWTFEGDFTFIRSDCKTVDAKTLDCALPDIPAHLTSNTLTAWVVAGAAGGHIVSTATVAFAGGETAPGPPSASLDHVVAANLKVAIAPPAELDTNGNITYRYTVSNASSAGATRLTSRVSFTAGSTFVAASGADCRETPQQSADLTMTCTMPDLGGGQSFTYAITVRPPVPQGHFYSSTTLSWEDPRLQAYAFGEATIYHDVFVSTTDDGGAGSLRAAIEETNARCVVDGAPGFPCRILFRVAGTIEPRSPLPEVTSTDVAIDGGGKVALRGTGTFADGLVLHGYKAIVKGLTIDGFALYGIAVRSKVALFTISGNTITGCGLRAIEIEGGSGEVAGNVLARNARSGIFMTGGGATIKDNTIVDNGASGIYIGPLAGSGEISGNTIARNRDFGIAIDTAATGIVRVNSIHDNGIDAIDIGLDGPSDPREPHRPAVTAARYDAASGDTIVTLSTGTPAAFVRTQTLLVYANAALDASGRAEAETFIGSVILHDAETTAELRVYGDLRGHYVTASNIAFFDYYGELQKTQVSELSDGVQVF